MRIRTLTAISSTETARSPDNSLRGMWMQKLSHYDGFVTRVLRSQQSAVARGRHVCPCLQSRLLEERAGGEVMTDQFLDLSPEFRVTAAGTVEIFLPFVRRFVFPGYQTTNLDLTITRNARLRRYALSSKEQRDVVIQGMPQM